MLQGRLAWHPNPAAAFTFWACAEGSRAICILLYQGFAARALPAWIGVGGTLAGTAVVMVGPTITGQVWAHASPGDREDRVPQVPPSQGTPDGAPRRERPVPSQAAGPLKAARGPFPSSVFLVPCTRDCRDERLSKAKRNCCSGNKAQLLFYFTRPLSAVRPPAVI